MSVAIVAKKVRAASLKLLEVSEDQRNQALQAIAQALQTQSGTHVQ